MSEYRDTSRRAEIAVLDIYIQFWYPLNLIYAGTAGTAPADRQPPPRAARGESDDARLRTKQLIAHCDATRYS